jgi:hypothetical protein
VLCVFKRGRRTVERPRARLLRPTLASDAADPAPDRRQAESSNR